jgi:hypothetical protein
MRKGEVHMKFEEADRRYNQLKQQYDNKTLSANAFEEALRDLMIQDAQGRWWSKSRDTGEWNYYDATSKAWIRASPPVRSPSQQSSAQPQAPSHQGGAAAPIQLTAPVTSKGLKVAFYFISLMIPIAGLVLFLAYKDRSVASDRRMATICLALGLLSIVLSCVIIMSSS